MTAILLWLGQFLTGPLLKGALDAYNAKLANQNSADGRTADLLAREIALDQREAELNQQLLVDEQGNWITRWVRPGFAAPFVIYVWKLVVWDKVLAEWTHGTTDPLSPWLAAMATTVLTAYFGGRSLEKIASIIKGRR